MTSVSSSILTGLMSTISGRRIVSIGGSESKALTEALVTDVEVPEIDTQIVSRYVCFLVGIDRNGVNVVCMSIGIDLSWDGGDDVILLCCAR